MRTIQVTDRIGTEQLKEILAKFGIPNEGVIKKHITVDDVYINELCRILKMHNIKFTNT